MKKFGKGMIITSTVAAALAALTFASCGSIGTAAKNAPVKSENAVLFSARNTKADEVGTAGSGCYENENTKADEVGTAGSNYCDFYNDWQAEGTFYEVTGSRIKLDITKSDMGDGLYNCFVTCSDSAFDSETYGFLARYENDTLIYDCGAKNFTSYDSDGNIVENYIIDEGHSGTITYTGAAGLRWTDSDGSSYVFMSDITLA